MTQGLLLPSPTPSHRKGDGGGKPRVPLLSKKPPAAASQPLTTCCVHWGQLHWMQLHWMIAGTHSVETTEIPTFKKGPFFQPCKSHQKIGWAQ